MSLRTWFRASLARVLGDDEAEPVSLVEVMTVQPFEVPVLREVLGRSGIAVGEIERFDGVGGMDKRVSLLVARRDAAPAEAALAEFRRR